MAEKNGGKKYLNFEKRKIIEAMSKAEFSISDIAKAVDMAEATIYREYRLQGLKKKDRCRYSAQQAQNNL